MTDEIDQAQGVEELIRGEAITRARGRQLSCDALEPNCLGCGEEIDEERRRANPKARRCLECQSAVERRDKLFLRTLL